MSGDDATIAVIDDVEAPLDGDLGRQLEPVGRLHRREREWGLGQVLLPSAMDRKGLRPRPAMGVCEA
ncbi:MAG TPA: hypothetical protein DDY78_21765 [Planctomycetales bacterium]|jgi:hypothetical protein|nr:hypothetical protein [Planctomycetales bacterium]